MKKIALKASVAALSVALTVSPMAFAQQTVAPQQQPVAAATNTGPLPGAKKASAALAATLGVTTTALVAAVAVVALAVGYTINEQNRSDDNDAAVLAALIAAGATTGTR